MLTIEPGLLIWTIITFVILLAVLGKLAWKPLLGLWSNARRRYASHLKKLSKRVLKQNN